MTNFWLNDLTVLFNRNNLLQIIPYGYLSLNEKLNSIFRLSIYFSVLMFLLKKDYRYFGVILIVGIMTILCYQIILIVAIYVLIKMTQENAVIIYH